MDLLIVNWREWGQVGLTGPIQSITQSADWNSMGKKVIDPLLYGIKTGEDRGVLIPEELLELVSNDASITYRFDLDNIVREISTGNIGKIIQIHLQKGTIIYYVKFPYPIPFMTPTKPEIKGLNDTQLELAKKYDIITNERGDYGMYAFYNYDAYLSEWYKLKKMGWLDETKPSER